MGTKEYAIIVAGGSGTRMKTSIPKQFLLLKGRPVLMYTIEAFSKYNSSISIVLVLPEHEQNFWENLCTEFDFKIPHQLKTGGKTRYESVKNGLKAIKEQDALVAIHDGVRPLISKDVIEQSFKVAAETGNAVVSVGLKDSIRKISLDGTSQAIIRDEYKLIQTPQTFRYSVIKDAYNSEDAGFTDDASVAEANGIKINLIEGSHQNLKITTPEDIIIAEAFLNS
jgi:2-C-methyl-D-erythritol 4-phosphate cytidylyltransferase